MLTEVDQAQYAGVFEPYTQGTSGQYTYRLEPGEGHSHLEAIGQVLRRLVSELAADYGAEAAYAVLERVYHEHFSEVEQAVRPKAGTDLSAIITNDLAGNLRRQLSAPFAAHGGSSA